MIMRCYRVWPLSAYGETLELSVRFINGVVHVFNNRGHFTSPLRLAKIFWGIASHTNTINTRAQMFTSVFPEVAI